jgi:hypothetical protein
MTPDGFRVFVVDKDPVLSLSHGGTEKNKVKGMISREGAKAQREPMQYQKVFLAPSRLCEKSVF